MDSTYTFTRTPNSALFRTDFGGDFEVEMSVKGDMSKLKEVETAALHGITKALVEYNAKKDQEASEPTAEAQDTSVETAVAAEAAE